MVADRDFSNLHINQARRHERMARRVLAERLFPASRSSSAPASAAVPTPNPA